MARGANGKIEVENKIKEAFGADYIGTYDKKLYVWADDGAEKVQIAISLTCPKNPVGATAPQKLVSLDGQGYDFTVENIPVPASIEFSEEEKNTIDELMKALDL